MTSINLTRPFLETDQDGLDRHYNDLYGVEGAAGGEDQVIEIPDQNREENESYGHDILKIASPVLIIAACCFGMLSLFVYNGNQQGNECPENIYQNNCYSTIFYATNYLNMIFYGIIACLGMDVPRSLILFSNFLAIFQIFTSIGVSLSSCAAHEDLSYTVTAGLFSGFSFMATARQIYAENNLENANRLPLG